jgi:hypothetical protein
VNIYGNLEQNTTNKIIVNREVTANYVGWNNEFPCRFRDYLIADEDERVNEED